MNTKSQLISAIFFLSDEEAQILLDSVILLNEQKGKPKTQTPIGDFIAQYGHKLTPAIIDILDALADVGHHYIEEITEFDFLQRKGAGKYRWNIFKKVRDEALSELKIPFE